MIVASDLTTVDQYFNEKWQKALIQVFGMSLQTKIRSLRVIDNPKLSFQFRERRVISSKVTTSQTLLYELILVNINWQWFSPDASILSKIRLDYHADDDLLYILNQKHRGNPLTVYDVIKAQTIH